MEQVTLALMACEDDEYDNIYFFHQVYSMSMHWNCLIEGNSKVFLKYRFFISQKTQFKASAIFGLSFI